LGGMSTGTSTATPAMRDSKDNVSIVVVGTKGDSAARQIVAHRAAHCRGSEKYSTHPSTCRYTNEQPPSMQRPTT
jgi:hypothetical protein